MTRLLAIPFSVRLAWLCWVVLLAAVSARVIISKPTAHSVVPIYRVAAERWRKAEPLYAPALPLDVYRNPPGFAAAFAIWTVLPETTAAVLWRLASALVVIIALRNLARHCHWSPSETGWAFTIVAFLSIPGIDNGQVNIIMAGCVAIGFTTAMQNRLNLAAVALALATAMKVYPFAAALLIIIIIPRLGLRYLAGAMILAILPFMLQPSHYVLDQYYFFWTSSALDDRSGSDFLFRVPHDWTIVPRIMFNIVVPASIVKIMAVGSGLTFAIIVRRKQSLITAFVLGSVWMTLFGPATELPTYALLAPAAAYWAVTHPGRGSYLMLALLAAPVLRGAFPTTEVLACRTTPALGALLLALLAMRNRSESVGVGPLIVIAHRTAAISTRWSRAYDASRRSMP